MDDETLRTTHITLTGPSAGQVLCRADKDRGVADFAHVPYSHVAEWLARPEICSACREIWNDETEYGEDDAR